MYIKHLCLYVIRWTRAHELLVQQKIRKDLLAMTVRESEAKLRSENMHPNICIHVFFFYLFKRLKG